MEILLVDADACSDLAKAGVFIDLITLRDRVNPDVGIFVSVYPHWNKPAQKLVNLMANYYEVIHGAYSNKKDSKEKTNNTVHSHAMVTLMSMLTNINPASAELTLITNNVMYASVVVEYLRLGAKCNWRTTLHISETGVPRCDRMVFNPLTDVPRRQPSIVGPRIARS